MWIHLHVSLPLLSRLHNIILLDTLIVLTMMLIVLTMIMEDGEESEDKLKVMIETLTCLLIHNDDEKDDNDT